ncbi:MAG: ABC transporter ATP-binding protein/permease [Puniceicoccales bacterium]|nr:ABC transporter ATP-binding protein/permease [Puniceicoccales bacterium]
MKLWGKLFRRSTKRITFLKYAKFLGNAKLKFFAAILAGILYGISSGFGIPVMLKFSAEKVFSVENLPLHVLLLAAMAPVFIMSLRAIFSVTNAYCLGFCGQKILQGLRVMVFDKIQRLPIDFFKKTEPGAIITKALADTSVLQNTIIAASQEIIKQPLALMGAVGALIYLCHRESDAIILLIFFLAVALVIFPTKIIGKKMREKTMALQSETEKITTKLAHNLSAVQEIRAFAMEEAEVSRYRTVCDSVMRSVMKTLKYSLMTSPLIEVIASFGIGIAMFYAYLRHIGPGVFISLTGALYLSYEPLKKIADLNSHLKAGSASLSRIEDLLNANEKIHDPKNPVRVDRLRGNISFGGVSFSYDGNENSISGITASIKRGKTYALVGSSGAGKTTMAHLILRFYDVTDGAIKIDGIDIRRMRLRDLRKNISFVPQNPTLLNGTILDNIRWSVPDASFERIVTAAKKAYADEFISELEDGYYTAVGEGGARLSGGQRQRIAIARAFLRDAPILILDEATSALDANSEHEVHIGIENLTKNRTSILISHRFTMMSIVDMVFVLDRGKIIEMGSPKNLAERKDSVYFELQEKQRVAMLGK